MIFFFLWLRALDFTHDQNNNFRHNALCDYLLSTLLQLIYEGWRAELYLRIKDRGGGRRIEALEDGLGDELEEKGDTADKERVSCFVCVLREDKGY